MSRQSYRQRKFSIPQYVEDSSERSITAMDDSLDTYHKPNRFFLSSIGLWPHQTALEKRFFFLLSFFFVVTQGYLQIGGMVMAWCETDIFLESLPPVAIDGVCYIKLFNFVYQTDKIKKLQCTMEGDWKVSLLDEELAILRDFGSDCRRKTLMYAGAVYGSMVPFMLGPLVPIVKGLLPIDLTTALNGTHERPLMFHVEYLLNVETWYYYVLIHSYFGTIVYITIVVAVDTMFLVYVQHACSLLAIIRYRLEHLVDKLDIDVDIYAPIDEDKPYHRLIQCIYRHNLAIEFVDMIESANAMALLFQLGINVLCLSFTGFQAVSKIDYPDQSIRYVSFLVAQVFSIFFASYPSECLIDESIRLLESITRSAWYLTSIRTRKLLNLMILRCTHPCYLTAGRFYVLNMQYFSTVIRTSMSYLTMLCSFQ